MNLDEFGSGRMSTFAFFMRDGSILETTAKDLESALEWCGKQKGMCSHMQRCWLLQEIEDCFTGSNFDVCQKQE